MAGVIWATPVGKDSPRQPKPLDYAPSTRIPDVLFWTPMTCFTSADLRKYKDIVEIRFTFDNRGSTLGMRFDDVRATLKKAVKMVVEYWPSGMPRLSSKRGWAVNLHLEPSTWVSSLPMLIPRPVSNTLFSKDNAVGGGCAYCSSCTVSLSKGSRLSSVAGW